MKAKIGDKVRVKSDKQRGIVQRVGKDSVLVQLNEGGHAKVSDAEVTNYSLAARKAWKKMPSRRVGRPKGTTKTDRVSVTLRIDRKLWDQFKAAESRGLISDRTATINAWIASELDELE